MVPDKLQQAWQAQSSLTRVTVDTDLLLKVVQRNQRDFRAMILRRDVIEVLVGLLMLPYWIYKGLTSPQPWTWWLTVPAIIWVVGFFVVDRIRHPQKPSDPGEPLLRCVKNSLTQVEHQIWLLSNVFWWYLLPFTISILTFFADVSWSVSKNWLVALGAAIPLFAFLVGTYAVIDYINQRCVRLQLEPRRRELLALLASLSGDDSAEERATKNRETSVESSSVLRRWLIVFVLSLVAFVVMGIVLTSGITDSSFDGPPRNSGPAGDLLAKVIAEQCKEKNLVGLAAMVTVDGQVEAAAAQGERKLGSGVLLEISDQWHLGGITKSITATMIARLVESGQMQWTDTIGEIFPETSTHEDWKPVTLWQLLTDTAGAPRDFSILVRLQRPAVGSECTQARREAVLKVIADKPEYTPGKNHVTSNVGYTIAGAMAEKVTGATWEDLVKREVFEPLELTDSGFGPPKSADKTLEQPRGHRNVLSGKVPVDDKTDNTPIMSPSGIIHMTLGDLCTYANEHVQGELGKGKLLSAETYKKLHAPELDNYACGWVRNEPNEVIPYTEYWHNGANTYWYALVAFIPETNMVVAVTSNDGDWENAEAAACEVLKYSVKQFKGGVDPSSSATPQTTVDSEKSPFAAVRWQESQPEVKVGDEWFKLVSLNDLSAAEIIAFSKRTYGNKWQKRFEEDLVALLTHMGHPPQDKVTLVVQSLTSSDTRTLEDVPMTKANRHAIREAAQDRERSNQPQGMRPAVPIDDAELFRSRIEEFLSAARTKAGFSGAVLVARGGKPDYEGAFGVSHLDSPAPNTLDTPFRIASLSKQFTAAAIFRLEAQGKLNIDDPVHQYLPEFAEAPYRDITIHHLLTHTSGLPRIPKSLMGRVRWNAMSQAATPVDDYVSLAVQTPLEFEPGADYEYSNIGYRVLSALIARVTGRDYADFMEQEIFQPLGMKDTGVARVTRPPSESRIAEGLTFRKLDSTGQPLFANGEDGRNYGAGYGSGGIYTSANDLLRWDRVLAGDEFLSESQKTRLFQPIHNNYACGWVVKKSDLDGRLYQMHSGANEGFFSQMMRVPEDDLVIITVGNVDDTPALDEVLDQLFRLCRSLPYREP